MTGREKLDRTVRRVAGLARSACREMRYAPGSPEPEFLGAIARCNMIGARAEMREMRLGVQAALRVLADAKVAATP